MDFVNVADLGLDGLAEVLELAAQVKTDRAAVAGTRPGLRAGLFFEKPSTRTRVSCEVAAADLGMVPLVLKQDEVGLGKRESVEDVGRVLDRYLDVLAFRVFDHQNLVALAASAEAPVINLLSDLEHPCQALADLQTVAEHRPLQGATVAFIGDGNNVCNSLMIAGVMMGTNINVASPAGHEPTAAMVGKARSGATAGAQITVTNDPAEAVAGADVIPWRPATGVYLLIEDGHSPADALVEVPGVAGVCEDDGFVGLAGGVLTQLLDIGRGRRGTTQRRWECRVHIGGALGGHVTMDIVGPHQVDAHGFGLRINNNRTPGKQHSSAQGNEQCQRV